jgi:hypothetical protein
MATLTVTQTEDYRDGNPAVPANTDSILFNTSAISLAIFGSNQFGGSSISNNIVITGDGFQNRLQVFLSAAGSFSAAGWTFSSWTSTNNFATPLDSIFLNGTSGADTITGSRSRIFSSGETARTH